MLDAGIDVLSTLNVQHLESLNDQVAELSGVRVRETIPDAVLGRADEVVLIDLTPEALLDRLRAGKVYPPERIEAALNGFFRIENLSALREVALRQVAEEVEAKRLVTEVVGTREDLAADLPQAVGERLLALVEPYPGRPAARAPRVALVPAPGRRARPALGGAARGAGRRRAGARAHGAAPARLRARRRPDRRGGRRHADTVARSPASAGTTYILMGSSRPARGLARLRDPAPPAAHGGAARRRRPDRRRPLPPAEKDTMSTRRSSP